MNRRPKPKDAVPPRTISGKETALLQGEISLHMSHFCLGYLREIYRHFEGDLALVIVT